MRRTKYSVRERREHLPRHDWSFSGCSERSRTTRSGLILILYLTERLYIYIICESPVFKRLVFQVSLYDFAYFTYIAYEIEGQAGLSIDL